MTAHTRISSKGQIVIPKAIRTDMKLPVGAGFEVVRQNDDILLRRERKKEGMSMDELMARLREISEPLRPFPRLTIKEISSVPEEALREHYVKKYP
ncbi:MAG: AbrB/MazE/SpoVT family DNA-binding domain-containing protein [Sphingomonadaceae bacterium]